MRVKSYYRWSSGRKRRIKVKAYTRKKKSEDVIQQLTKVILDCLNEITTDEN